MDENNILVIVLSVVLLMCMGGVLFSTPLALSTAAFQFITTIGSMIVGGAATYLWPKGNTTVSK